MAGAVEFTGETIPLVAAADLSAKQFFFIKVVAAGEANVTTAATDTILGILQNKPLAGEIAQVKVMGGSKLLCGATTAVGDRVISDGAGEGIPEATAGDTIGAIALEAGANGDVFSVFITHQISHA